MGFTPEHVHPQDPRCGFARPNNVMPGPGKRRRQGEATMSDVRKVLIVGGGVGGMSLAICLRRLNVQVNLIDADPSARVRR